MTNEEKAAQLNYGTRIVPGGSIDPSGSLVVEAAVEWHGIGGTGCELPAEQCPAMMARIQAGLKKRLRIWVPGISPLPVTARHTDNPNHHPPCLSPVPASPWCIFPTLSVVLI